MAKPKSNLPVITELSGYLETCMNEVGEVVQTERNLKRAFELHPSSFPYCPLRHAYEITESGIPTESFETFADLYFVTIGTVFHELIQRFMAIGGKVHGMYSCRDKKGCGWVADDIGPYPVDGCPDCGGHLHYDEIGIEIDGTLYGHIDGLYEDANGEFWVIDYKTTMLMKNEKHMRTGDVYPYLANKAQIRSYVVCVHYLYGKSHGYRPKGWVLLYHPRDNPFRYVLVGERVSPQDKADIWARITHDMEAFRAVVAAEKWSDIRHYVDTKPCGSRKQYDEEMASPYGECPLLPVCFNKKALVGVLQEAMDGNVYLPLTQFKKEKE